MVKVAGATAVESNMILLNSSSPSPAGANVIVTPALAVNVTVELPSSHPAFVQAFVHVPTADTVQVEDPRSMKQDAAVTFVLKSTGPPIKMAEAPATRIDEPL